jgi:hypothetical protein
MSESAIPDSPIYVSRSVSNSARFEGSTILTPVVLRRSMCLHVAAYICCFSSSHIFTLAGFSTFSSFFSSFFSSSHLSHVVSNPNKSRSHAKAEISHPPAIAGSFKIPLIAHVTVLIISLPCVSSAFSAVSGSPVRAASAKVVSPHSIAPWNFVSRPEFMSSVACRIAASESSELFFLRSQATSRALLASSFALISRSVSAITFS